MTIRSKVLAGALAALVVLALAPVGRTDVSRPMLVAAHPASEAEAAYLMTHFDETHNHSPGTIELLLWPGDLAELDALGVDYDVLVEDLFARDRALGTKADTIQRLPGPDRDDYRRLADYGAELKDLAKKNPDLVKYFEMKRPSLEGRTVSGVEIAANVKDVATDGRPIFYVDGVHHAREWPAAEYPMIWAHHLVESYGKDPKVTSLLKKARVILVPIVNVDGFDYSRESLAQNENLSAGNGFEGYWRKNRRSLTGVTAPAAQRNPDAYGVDPNRNYSYLWGDGNGGSSGSQIDQTYRGSAPFSEPETQNVKDIVLSRQVTMVLTNHTYQASVLRAGGGDSPEDGILERMGAEIADILGYRNSPTVGYPTTGTTDDWAYAAMGSLGFTIEHGSIGFHPPYGEEVGTYWKQHMEAFDRLLGYAADPKYHSVIKGRVAGGNAVLSIKKSFLTPLSPGNPTGEEAVPEEIKMKLQTSKDGSFVWHVSPSDRPYEKQHESFALTISAGGKSKTIQLHIERGEVVDLGTIKL